MGKARIGAAVRTLAENGFEQMEDGQANKRNRVARDAERRQIGLDIPVIGHERKELEEVGGIFTNEAVDWQIFLHLSN